MIMPATQISNLVKADTKTFTIKGYRHSNAALIEWTKVNGASWYKISRATKKKGGKYTKFKKIGTVTENWFTKYGDNILKTRWFVNVCYDGRKKCPQKGHRYNHKKTYKYKVVALKGKSVISSSKIITVKKYKNKKYQPGYEMLYYANKERYKAKRRVLPWGHVLEKGTKKRIKDIVFRDKRGDNFKSRNSNGFIYHQRPKERLTSFEKKYSTSDKNTWMYLRGISPSSLQPFNIGKHRENIHEGPIYGYSVIKTGYMNSPGHKKTLLQKEDKYGMYCSFTSEHPDFEITILHSIAGAIISTNYDNYSTEQERRAQDKCSKVITKKYKPILDEAYKYIQQTLNQGFDLEGYLGFTFAKNDLNKYKSFYPWTNNDLIKKYFNDTTNSYYKTESYWEYDNNGIQREHKYTTLKPEYKTVANQMYVNFIKDYARLIPYK